LFDSPYCCREGEGACKRRKKPGVKTLRPAHQSISGQEDGRRESEEERETMTFEGEVLNLSEKSTGAQ
jgi:hypothetical protein